MPASVAAMRNRRKSRPGGKRDSFATARTYRKQQAALRKSSRPKFGSRIKKAVKRIKSVRKSTGARGKSIKAQAKAQLKADGGTFKDHMPPAVHVTSVGAGGQTIPTTMDGIHKVYNTGKRNPGGLQVVHQQEMKKHVSKHQRKIKRIERAIEITAGIAALASGVAGFAAEAYGIGATGVEGTTDLALTNASERLAAADTELSGAVGERTGVLAEVSSMVGQGSLENQATAFQGVTPTFAQLDAQPIAAQAPEGISTKGVTTRSVKRSAAKITRSGTTYYRDNLLAPGIP